MKADSIITIFYLLPLIVCTTFTTKNIVRLLDEGYRLRATKIYNAFLFGAIPIINILIAGYNCALAIFDAIADLTELFEELKNEIRNNQ